MIVQLARRVHPWRVSINVNVLAARIVNVARKPVLANAKAILRNVIALARVALRSKPEQQDM